MKLYQSKLEELIFKKKLLSEARIVNTVPDLKDTGKGYNFGERSTKRGNNTEWDGPWSDILEYEICHVLSGGQQGSRTFVVIDNSGTAQDNDVYNKDVHSFAVRYDMSEMATGQIPGTTTVNVSGVHHFKMYPPKAMQGDTIGKLVASLRIYMNKAFKRQLRNELNTIRKVKQKDPKNVVFDVNGQAWTDIAYFETKSNKVTKIISFHAKYNNGDSGRFIGLTGNDQNPFHGMELHSGAQPKLGKCNAAWDRWHEYWVSSQQGTMSMSNTGTVSRAQNRMQATGRDAFVEQFNQENTQNWTQQQVETAREFKSALIDYVRSRLSGHKSYMVHGSGTEGNIGIDAIDNIPADFIIHNHAVAIKFAEQGVFVGLPENKLDFSQKARLANFPRRDNHVVLWSMNVRNDPVKTRAGSSMPDPSNPEQQIVTAPSSSQQAKANRILSDIQNGVGLHRPYPNAVMRLEPSSRSKADGSTSIYYYFYEDATLSNTVKASKTSKHDVLQPTTMKSEDGSGDISVKAENASKKYSLIGNLLK